MVNPVGFRFRPTDEEIVDHYLRVKNLESDTSHVDEVISTVDICSLEPWNLPSQSMIKSSDAVWHFFGRKENKYNRGDRQMRKTKSGFWKKTGVTINIMRKRGNREKIGEKKVLMFYFNKSLKSDWVMHEYHATFSSPNLMTYTLCKVKFKGESREGSVSSGSGIELTHSLIPHTNDFGVFSVETEEETQLEDAVRRAINNISTDDWDSLFNDDEQR
ncbi:unnamed protein product [Arabidopsis lyrata]|uniref:NAC domain-containing protein n=1 Tax=Arabidopsis lyrata subsp. lyrata TaxID=81972 RepID=D7KB65_ARALL|nr:hypothetical protein ARALYDRAFT_333558 [Arabidopsis lyrata subsp. lyrata]CAH8250895.1 unnamed protein product [Arabidopsis lyrata]